MGRPPKSYSKAYLSRATILQKKLILYVGDRSARSVAELLSVPNTTLDNWLKGRAVPKIEQFRNLAEVSRLPLEYWSNDSIPPQTISFLISQKSSPVHDILIPMAGFVVAENQTAGGDAMIVLDHEVGVSYKLNAKDPRALDVRGDSAWPLAAQGQHVIFDAGRPCADDPDYDGKLVVAELDGEIVVKQRLTQGDQRIYVPINGSREPIIIPAKDAKNEYPVVAFYIDAVRVEDPAE